MEAKEDSQKEDEFDDLPNLTDASETTTEEDDVKDEVETKRTRRRSDCDSNSLSSFTSGTESKGDETQQQEQTAKPRTRARKASDEGAKKERKSSVYESFADPTFGKNLCKAFSTDKATTQANAPNDGSPSIDEPQAEQTGGSKKKRKKSQSQQKTVPPSDKEKKKALDLLRQLKGNLHTLLKLATDYLKAKAFTKAVEKYQEAFGLLETHEEKHLLDEKETFALNFCYVTACIECKTVDYFEKAASRFTKMDQTEKTLQNFSHLYLYVRGQFYARWNNYEEGLRECTAAKELISNCSDGFTNLLYPGLEETIPITNRTEYEEQLKRLLDTCKFPPKPDARCCKEDCTCLRHEIYRSDAKFDGYYLVRCTSGCQKVGFHPACYKTFMRKLGAGDAKPCPTPSCDGFLYSGDRYDKGDPTPKPFTISKVEQAKKPKDCGKVQNAKRKAGGAPKLKTNQERGRRKARSQCEEEVPCEFEDAGIESLDIQQSADQNSVDDVMIEREAHPLRRDEDETATPQKKKKSKKKAAPVIVSLTPRTSHRDDSGTDGLYELEDNYHYVPRDHRKSSSDQAETGVIDLHFSSEEAKPQHSEAVDTFLSILHAMLNQRETKSMLLCEEELLDLFDGSTEVNELMCENGGMDGFLRQYGEAYRLTADDESVYLLEEDSDNEYYSGEEEPEPDDAHTQVLDTVVSQKPVDIRKNEDGIQKQNVYKEDIARLKKELAAARNEEEETKREQKETVDNLKSRRDALLDQIAELKSETQRDRQKFTVEMKHNKLELDKLVENANQLQFTVDVKAADAEKLQHKVNGLKRANRELEKMAQKKYCTCLEDGKKEEQRALDSEATYLSVKREIEIRDLENAYRVGQKFMDNLRKAAGGTSTTDDAALMDAYSTYVRKVQDYIVDVGQKYDHHIHEVERGVPLDSLPTIDAPELPRLPTLPQQTKVTQVSAEAAVPAAGFGAGDAGASEGQQGLASAARTQRPTAPPGFENTAAMLLVDNAAATDQLIALCDDTNSTNSDENNASAVAPAAAIGGAGGRGGVANGPAGKAENVSALVAAACKEFPYLPKSRVIEGIRELRKRKGGTLNGVQGLVDELCQLLRELQTEGSSGNKDDEECMICYEKLKLDSTFNMVACRHIFHDKCIRPWLIQGNSCPVCGH